ncbi:MAG: type III restriction enzyme, Res subunit, partial [Methylococcaceae bacterium NSP1-2]
VTKQLLKTVSGVAKKHIAAQVEFHNLRIESNKAPAMRGEVFAALPQLCCVQDDLLELLTPDSFLYLSGNWSLQNYPAELPQFELKETAKHFEVDIAGEKVFYKTAGESEVENLDWVESGITETDLVRWLDRKVKQPDINQASCLLFLSQLLRNLTQTRQIPLTGLEALSFNFHYLKVQLHWKPVLIFRISSNQTITPPDRLIIRVGFNSLNITTLLLKI